MKNFNYKKILAFIFSFTLVFLLPLFMSYAAYGGGTTIQNPLGANNTKVEDILMKIMNLVVMAGTIVVVFFIIYSGYKFVTARGNPAEVTKAKDIFFATVIGGAILLGADVIATVVVNTVNSTVGR